MPAKKVDPNVFSPPEVEEFNSLEAAVDAHKELSSTHEERIQAMEKKHQILIDVLDHFGIR